MKTINLRWAKPKPVREIEVVHQGILLAFRPFFWLVKPWFPAEVPFNQAKGPGAYIMYNIYVYMCVCIAYAYAHKWPILIHSLSVFSFVDPEGMVWAMGQKKALAPKATKIGGTFSTKKYSSVCVYIYSSTETTILNLSTELQNIRHL